MTAVKIDNAINLVTEHHNHNTEHHNVERGDLFRIAFVGVVVLFGILKVPYFHVIGIAATLIGSGIAKLSPGAMTKKS